MKTLKNFSISITSYNIYSFTSFFGVLILFFASCTRDPEPYSIVEISGAGNVSNYSKSFLLMLNKSDSINPTPLIAGSRDVIVCDEKLFIYDKVLSQNKYLIKNHDSVLYINGLLNSFDIPENDNMIPWIENLTGRDLSALQFISFNSKVPESYLPLLKELAKAKPDPGLYFTGDFAEMAKLFKIFKPRYIASPNLVRSDFDMLSKLTGLEILIVSIEDSVINDPLPALPSLKQLFLSNSGKEITLSDNLLVNNRQIERLIIQKSGSIDFALLKPLDNLKELVISGVDGISNFEEINSHKKLEVFSVTGDELKYDLSLIKLPLLRWIAFSSNATQEEFSSFIGIHPGLEIIEIIENRKISNLKPLSKLNKLYGLTVTDTVTDINSIKGLTSLKYLSLPYKLLGDKFIKTELQRSLPDTRITANEGICLGSGWLLLMIPMVIVFRFFGRRQKSKLQDGVKQ